jgi:serine/threonine protein kinase
VCRSRKFEKDLTLHPSAQPRHAVVAVAWLPVCQQLPTILQREAGWSSVRRFCVISETAEAEVFASTTEVIKIVKGIRRQLIHDIYGKVRLLAQPHGGKFLAVPTKMHWSTRRKDGKADLLLKFARHSEVAIEEMKDVTTRRQLASEIATAVTMLHSQSIVHHDVRLSNVLKTSGGNFVLNDLGEARLLSAGKIPPVCTLSPSNHAPTVREDHSTEVDIWGLAYLFGELQSQEKYEDLTEMQSMLDSVAQRPGYDLGAGKAALEFIVSYTSVDQPLSRETVEQEWSDQYYQVAINSQLLCGLCKQFDPYATL